VRELAGRGGGISTTEDEQAFEYSLTIGGAESTSLSGRSSTKSLGGLESPSRLSSMAKCELGKRLFKEWKEASTSVDLYQSRAILPSGFGGRPVTIGDPTENALRAQSAFLSHSRLCDDCMYFDGRDEE
jgi:hypothetical protein